MRRRDLLIGGAAVLSIGPAMRAAAASDLPYGGELRFQVLRDGSAFGTHVLRFSREGGRIVVDGTIDLAVRLAFITVFRYTHRKREVWEGDRLVAFDATTDDDGTTYVVKVRPEGDRLRVDGWEGPHFVAADVPVASYWRPRMILWPTLINTQYGNIEEPKITDLGIETVTAGGRSVRGSRHSVVGRWGTFDTWYAGEEWLKLSSSVRGSVIDYVRLTPVPDGVG
jgi:hypothetical protein